MVVKADQRCSEHKLLYNCEGLAYLYLAGQTARFGVFLFYAAMLYALSVLSRGSNVRRAWRCRSFIIAMWYQLRSYCIGTRRSTSRRQQQEICSPIDSISPKIPHKTEYSFSNIACPFSGENAPRPDPVSDDVNPPHEPDDRHGVLQVRAVAAATGQAAVVHHPHPLPPQQNNTHYLLLFHNIIFIYLRIWKTHYNVINIKPLFNNILYCWKVV